MSTLTVAAVQMRSSDDPDDNARVAVDLVRAAAARGAGYVQTPEVTNLVQRDREKARRAIRTEADDPVLAALRALAAELTITVHVGSLALNVGDRWVNRAILIAPDGAIQARYDKIHLFDVSLPSGETFRESATYSAGACGVLAPLGDHKLGITICFDLRFPTLYSRLGDAGATILTAPSAFAMRTGRDHWHTLVRSRAIENGAYLIAATQEGKHADGRTTFGHSVIIDPWGDVLAEATETPSVITATVSTDRVNEVRRQIPSIEARRSFTIETCEPLALKGAS